MEIKNMAYWKAKNGNSPLKQAKDKGERKPYDMSYNYYEGDQFKNPKGQSQKDVMEGRIKKHTDYISKVNKYAKTHGLSEEQSKKAQKKADSLYKDFTTSRDSIGRVNKQYEIKKDDAAGDLFD